MSKHLKYAKYVARHKWYVYRAGRAVGAPLWRLIIHDWSKLTPAEWGPYVTKFYGDWGSATSLEHADAIKATVGAAFNAAWLHHQHHSPHHWQHWILQEDDGGVEVLAMPLGLIREMVADWAGAGRAITGKWDVEGWYQRNKSKIVLESETRACVEFLLPIVRTLS